ncbi:hypothetical protein [Butyricimonas synergistica]|uniref:hypothetical protein n=1 Tax=Butyricimonas synergistica TaxID=544644 RepID=UPI00036CA456|nr:hypothetical protein [Butyricimonas synergistica]
MSAFLNCYFKSVENIVLNIEAIGYDYTYYFCSLLGIRKKMLVKTIKVLTPVIMTGYALCCIILFLGKYIYSLFTCKSQVNENRYDNIFLLFTYLLSSRIRCSDIDYKNGVWIIGPNLSVNDLPDENIKYIDIRSMYRRHNYRYIIIDALCGCIKVIFGKKTLTPLHKLFEYLEVGYCLNELPPSAKIFFSNQSDRWALLFDSLNVNTRVLIQHGVDIAYPNTFNRLKNVDVFYSINKSSYLSSFKFLLDCSPKLLFLKPTIQLTTFEKSEFKILLVTGPLFFNVERSIIERIVPDSSLYLFVKKHPLIKDISLYVDLQNKFKFEFITESIFPKVDCVISYESTLAYEYQGFDIPVIFVSENNFDIEKTLKQVYDIKKQNVTFSDDSHPVAE